MTLVKKPEAALAAFRDRIAEIDAEEHGIANSVVLARLHVAGGGLPLFQDDADETYKTVTGIVAISRIARSYWSTAFGEGESGGAPDCSSVDGVIGVGDPGGVCANCELNEWPGGGEGKPCRELRRLVLLADEGTFLLTLQPTSLQGWDRYASRLRASGLRYYAVRTRFSVDVAESKSGIKYGRVVPTAVEPLDEAALADVLAQYDSWAGMLAQQRRPDITIDADEDTEI